MNPFLPYTSHQRTPAWTDRIMYTTHSDSSDTSEDSAITNILYTTIPSYTTSDHVCADLYLFLSHENDRAAQKPIVALLLLPPASSGDYVPLLSLPPGFTPRPDPFAAVKKYTGRVIDRTIGFVWWLLVIVGVGHATVGIANVILGFGTWTWWKSRQVNGSGNV